MQFHILTLFPEMVENALAQSIIGRAQKDKKIGIETINVEPLFTSLKSVILPPWSSTNSFVIVSPRPVELSFLV